MPTFHFDALDNEGNNETGQIEAESANEAIQLLRSRGSFVTKLKNGSSRASGDGVRFTPAERSNGAMPSLMLAAAAAGLAGFLFGIWLFGSELHFRAGAKKVTALKVRDAVQGTALQIRDGKRVIKFPTSSEDNRALGPVDVLYNPVVNAVRYQYESRARLHGGPFFAALGSLFALVAFVGLRNLRGGVPAAGWIEICLLLAGVAALTAVVCWIIAVYETGWRWSLTTCFVAICLTSLAIAALTVVKHGFRGLLGMFGND